MKIGISSWAFAWSIGVPGYPKPSKPLDFEGLLRRTKELGLHLLQVADNFPLDKFEDSTLRSMASKAKEMGIEIEVGTSGISHKNLLKYLELAKLFDSRIVRTVIRPEEIKAGLSSVIENIRSVLPRFIEEDVHLIIENYEQVRADQLLRIFKTFNSEYLGLCLDTTNSIGAVEPIDEITMKLLPYIQELHLKDYQVYRFNHKFGIVVIGAPLGEGKLDLDWILNTLINAGKDINIILEQWLPFTRSLEETLQLEAEWIWKSLTVLREKLKSLSKNVI